MYVLFFCFSLCHWSILNNLVMFFCFRRARMLWLMKSALQCMAWQGESAMNPNLCIRGKLTHCRQINILKEIPVDYHFLNQINISFPGWCYYVKLFNCTFYSFFITVKKICTAWKVSSTEVDFCVIARLHYIVYMNSMVNQSFVSTYF